MATLNNAPFGKFGTCIPGGAALPPPPIQQPNMLFHYDATHVYNNLEIDYYDNTLHNVRRSDWASTIKGEKNNILWGDFHYVGKIVQEDFLTHDPRDNTLECLVYPKVGDVATVYYELSTSTRFLYINANGINNTVPIPGGVLNRWLHIVYAKTDDVYSIYVNGEIVTTLNETSVMRRYRAGYEGYELGYARGFLGTPPINELYDEAGRWLELFGQTF